MYKRIELEEGVEVVYVGVHALRWKHQLWGPPSVGFVPVEEPEIPLYAEVTGPFRPFETYPAWFRVHLYAGEGCERIRLGVLAPDEKYREGLLKSLRLGGWRVHTIKTEGEAS